MCWQLSELIFLLFVKGQMGAAHIGAS
jgi:hypothetical protein